MGTPKAGINLAGRPLISYVIDAAREAGLSPLVIAKPRSSLPSLDCTIVEEPAEPTHPLVGVIAALEHCRSPVVVLACDLPLLPPALIAALAELTEQFAMPVHPRPQPLIARYTPKLLPRLRQALVRREPLVPLAAELGGRRLGREEVDAFGDSDWSFANANEPGELERIGAELVRRRRA